MKIRPAVRRFAEAMERKLRKHDGDWGDSWKGMFDEDIRERFDAEFKELEAVWYDEAKRRGEAADVANFLMFLVEKRDPRRYGR